MRHLTYTSAPLAECCTKQTVIKLGSHKASIGLPVNQFIKINSL